MRVRACKRVSARTRLPRVTTHINKLINMSLLVMALQICECDQPTCKSGTGLTDEHLWRDINMDPMGYFIGF